MDSHATLEWFGCTTFRFSVDGITVFLDAYIDRAPGADGPPGATAAGITEADWIVVGHSHFDHLWGAHTIALNTGARIIGTYETARLMREAGVPDEQIIPVAGGERIRVSDTMSVTVIPSLHSCWWAPYDDRHPTNPCLGFTGLDHFTRTTRAESNITSFIEPLEASSREHIDSIPHAMDTEGGTLDYLFETPEGTLLFSDTPGYWTGLMKDVSADVAVLGVSGRPNIDGDAHQGSLAEFVEGQLRLIGARRLIPSHHDDYLPGFSGPFGCQELADALSVEMCELDYSTAFPVFQDL